MNEKKRGFAAMSADLQRQYASLGGKTCHLLGKGHEWGPEEAQAAGRKGGIVVSMNREYMREIGKRGGRARAARMAQKV